LAKDTTLQDKLRQELETLREADGSFSFKSLQAAEYLNGVINESLRLHPAVPSGVLRLTPPEGITIGTTFIPGNTTVVAPSYTIGRREWFSAVPVTIITDLTAVESCYENAEQFIPERWYSKPEMIKYKAAFAPFSLGMLSALRWIALSVDINFS
jgi:cytochrome P450